MLQITYRKIKTFKFFNQKYIIYIFKKGEPLPPIKKKINDINRRKAEADKLPKQRVLNVVK